MIKRGSSVDRVGLTPQSNVAAGDAQTGMNPIALPDAISPDGGGSIAKASDGGMHEKVVPDSGVTNCSPGAGKNFKANTGYENP